jgi:hypothetical protein
MNNALFLDFNTLLPSNNPLILFFHELWDTRREESNVHFDLFRFIPSHSGLMAVKTSWHILHLFNPLIFSALLSIFYLFSSAAPAFSCPATKKMEIAQYYAGSFRK